MPRHFRRDCAPAANLHEGLPLARRLPSEGSQLQERWSAATLPVLCRARRLRRLAVAEMLGQYAPTCRTTVESHLAA